VGNGIQQCIAQALGFSDEFALLSVGTQRDAVVFVQPLLDSLVIDAGG